MNDSQRILRLEQEIKRLRTIEVGSLVFSSNDVSSPPTEAEITTAFGAPGSAGNGRIFILIDNGSTSAEYLCISDGTTWQYLALTKAV